MTESGRAAVIDDMGVVDEGVILEVRGGMTRFQFDNNSTAWVRSTYVHLANESGGDE